MLAPESRIRFHPAQLSLELVAQAASAASASGKIRVLVDGIVDPFAGLEGGNGATEGAGFGLLATGAVCRRPGSDQRQDRSSERHKTSPTWLQEPTRSRPPPRRGGGDEPHPDHDERDRQPMGRYPGFWDQARQVRVGGEDGRDFLQDVPERCKAEDGGKDQRAPAAQVDDEGFDVRSTDRPSARRDCAAAREWSPAAPSPRPRRRGPPPPLPAGDPVPRP